MSAELHPNLPVAVAAVLRSLREQMMAVVKLAVIGGLAFAVGFLAIVAMRSVGLAAGLLATVSGPMLIANVVGRLYPG